MKIYYGSEIKQPMNMQNKPMMDADPKTAKAKEGDKVDFSTQLQQVQGMKNGFSPDSDRQARLQEIKAQIANGSYAPDLEKVAASFLKYIIEGNRNG